MSHPLTRLRITIEYDGTDFVGWQRQPNGPSVQQALEETLATMTGQPTIVRGAGRTDAGVHAAGQVAHFDTAAAIPVVGFRRGLNALLPRAISILELDEAPPDFDARFSARGKLYRYRIWNRDSRSALLDRFNWHIPRPLDLARMNEAASRLVGEHDFSAFRAADCQSKTAVRHLTRLAAERHGDEIVVEAEGNAFLKNMVRILVGTLVDVGRGRTTPDDVARILASRDRRASGKTAPPRGLTLVRVDYPRLT